MPERDDGLKFVSLRTGKISELTGLSEKTLRKLAEEDKVPHEWFGARLYVQPTRIIQWLEEVEERGLISA